MYSFDDVKASSESERRIRDVYNVMSGSKTNTDMYNVPRISILLFEC